MGKFSFSYSNSILKSMQGQIRNGIGFDLINQVINAIPGVTFILGIYENVSTDTWTVQAENYNFSDNTIVIPRYRIVTNSSILGPSSYTVFDGIDIIDPPSPSQVSNNSQTTVNTAGGNYTFTIPSTPATITATVYGHSSGPRTYTLKNSSNGIIKVDRDLLDALDTHTAYSKCTCGADKCGGLHSGWCDKKNG